MYDVALVGVGTGANYGSALSYFAIVETIQSMGKSVLLINKIGTSSSDREASNDNPSLAFARQNVAVSSSFSFDDIHQVNDMAETFVVGTDQVWNYGISRGFRDSFYLDFVDASKRKISIASSFGHPIDFVPDDVRPRLDKLFKRFNAISVREYSAVDLMKSKYGLTPTQILEPIFYVSNDRYFELAQKATVLTAQPYLLSYLLDKTDEKQQAVEAMANKLGLEIRELPDGMAAVQTRAEALFTPNDVLQLFKNASYVITDSFHGTSFSIKFNKNFVSFVNRRRGVTRFDTIFNIIGDESRKVYNPVDVTSDVSKFIDGFDYSTINESIRNEVSRAKNWIREALAKDIHQLVKAPNLAQPEIEKFLTSRTFSFGRVSDNVTFSRSWIFLRNGSIGGYDNENERKWRVVDDTLEILNDNNEVTSSFPLSKQYKKGMIGHSIKSNDVELFLRTKRPYDMVQVKILVSLLKQHGIQHIVASSGTRDVSILRMIERNSDFFKVHPMGDERSAAYFAHGLSIKLGKPVALVCTSGTAASNYLPGVSEAYYYHTPLVVITADRHPMFLNNHDDQTIPQSDMYRGVVKKSVTLTSGEHSRFEWFATKEIQSTILEATHGTPGPVHINIPILTIERSAPEDEDFELLKTRLVKRITRHDPESAWNAYANTLKRTDRIMVLYGQNQPLAEDKSERIQDFARTYHAVVIAEHISNVHGPRVVNPFHFLSQVSQRDFNRDLMPQVLISVGGTQIMNHPITGLLRGSSNKMRHWIVDPNGDYTDKFYHLTSIIECNQDYFFDFLIRKGEQLDKGDVYFQTWMDRLAEHPQLETGTSQYDQFNIEGKLLSHLPQGSMLHLGIGNTFMMTQHFALHPSIEVQCNMGTNGIDGSASTFMGQLLATPTTQYAFLLIGDLSFFYDMNSVINKPLTRNIRIMLINNGKAGLLEHHKVDSITQSFTATARGWVESLGFSYISARNTSEFDSQLSVFVSDRPEPLFFEVFI
ncbi:MAG: 2-succinyl-5-enolpyruvyl-6-hydroxy-3-cyclohexene-1-carboxylic-acid synthase [Propionibacteriaceae bacterium]|nr:2-succinyl-5-enolpyruvyl-6-hydroxy-3-cyclohexene-1-carboxylic-acid synthase [Propionibacteriaceae bacterium]